MRWRDLPQHPRSFLFSLGDPQVTHQTVCGQTLPRELRAQTPCVTPEAGCRHRAAGALVFANRDYGPIAV
jgi:hypothetical protein